MLRFEFTDINDKKVTAESVLSLDINIEEDVPADDLSARFAYFECDELKEVTVYDNDEIIFSGIVDEQQIIKDANGEYVRIIARSMAALLLDNESMPMCYTNPSVSLMLTHHLSPFSLTLEKDSFRAYYGTQIVQKGDSNYKTIQDFSKSVFGGNPRVNELKELCFPENLESKEVLFSDTLNGINYFSYSENFRRCDEISQVNIKLLNKPNYDAEIVNEDAQSRGIKRIRYLDAAKMDTPAVYAKKMIDASKKKSYMTKLSCFGRHLRILHCNAKVSDSVYGVKDKLYVSALRYSLSTKGEYTVVTLKRKEDENVVA